MSGSTLGGRDPGLQPERTALAWQRTGLAAAGICLLLGLTALRLDSPIVASVAAALAIATMALGLFRFPRGSRVTAAAANSWPILTRMATIVMIVAVFGALLATQRLVTAHF